MPTPMYLVDALGQLAIGGFLVKELRPVRGGVAASYATNTVTGGGANVQATAGAGGTALYWLSRPLEAVTISGSVTIALRGLESNLAANVGLRVTIVRLSQTGTVLGTILDSSHTVELTTADAAYSWSATPTSTTLAAGDRLRIAVFGIAAGGPMASGNTFTLSVNGPTAAAAGDAAITFTESLAERTPTGLGSGLAAYWKLDETSGVRHDLIGASHLADINTVTSGTGIRGTAASFAIATLEELTCADNAALSMGDIPFTIAAWVNLATLAIGGAGREIFQKYRTPLDSSDDWEYSIACTGGTNQYRVHVGNGAGGFASLTNPLVVTAAAWRLVIAWHDPDANLLGIQIDGGTPETTPYTGGSYDGAGGFRMGGNASNPHYMDGRIDGAGIWKRVLTADERTALYNGGAGWDEVLTYASGGATAPRMSLLGVG